MQAGDGFSVVKLSGEEFIKIHEVVDSFLKKGDQGNPPKFVILMGPIASGKTTIRREKYADGYVLVDSGELSDIFSENTKDTELIENYLIVAGTELVRQAVELKKNIIIEIIGDKEDPMKNVVSKMVEIGYKPEIIYIGCDLEECIRREEARGRSNVSSFYSQDETLMYFLRYFANSLESTTTNRKINKEPFDFLDAYPEEAFRWAEKVWAKIGSKFDSDNFDIEMVSVALAHIYGDFVHVSMNIRRDDFEYYFSELYGEEKVEEKWELMCDYVKKIYKAMSLEYASDYEIFLSLKESVLVKDEEDDNVDIVPMGFSDGDALTFVGNGFIY